VVRELFQIIQVIIQMEAKYKDGNSNEPDWNILPIVNKFKGTPCANYPSKFQPGKWM